MKHIDQMWGGYGVVYRQLKGNFPFNTGYHVMIMVIAGSTTVEYTLKAWYETVVGRLTQSDELTVEDKFDQRYMSDYVRFIEDTPWYEYNFNRELFDLWSTPFFGPHFLRKVERKYFLTTELLIKSGYGYLIKLGTKASYDAALLNTAVMVDHLPDSVKSPSVISNSYQFQNGYVLANLPRYARFNGAVTKLGEANINFKEVAGNTGAIILTVITSNGVPGNNNYKVLFTQPIFTRPGIDRMALITTVPKLSYTVRTLRQHNIQIEHIYDY